MEEKIKIDDRFVVSKETAKWVYLYKEIEDLWGKLSDAIEEDYGIDSVDKIMAKDFEKPLLKIIDALQEHFKNSAFGIDHLADTRQFPLII